MLRGPEKVSRTGKLKPRRSHDTAGAVLHARLGAELSEFFETRNRHPILDRFVPAILIGGGTLIGLYSCYSYFFSS
jgi:hypothetical protein